MLRLVASGVALVIGGSWLDEGQSMELRAQEHVRRDAVTGRTRSLPGGAARLTADFGRAWAPEAAATGLKNVHFRRTTSSRGALPQDPPWLPFLWGPPAAGPSLAQTISSPNVDAVTLADTGVVPPDTMGDVGPSQYLVAVNGRVRTIDKSTGSADGVIDTTLNLFFDTVRGGQLAVNPRVRYDRMSARWFVLAATLAVPNHLMLAVSSSDVISGATTWQYFLIPNTRLGGTGGTQPCLADFPSLGVDEDALYIGVNQFCGPTVGSLTFDSTSGYVVNKASVLDGPPAVVTVFDELAAGAAPGPFAPRGVDNFDTNTNVGYFIGVDNTSLDRLQLIRIADPGGTPTRSASITIDVAPTELPAPVPHPGSMAPLDALDDRLVQAVVRAGRLWTIHQIETDGAGTATSGGGRTSLRWYELQNLDATPSVRQFGTVFDAAAVNPASYFMGSLMVSGQGHVAIGSTVAGAATYVNAMATGRLAGDPLGQTNGPPQVFTSNASFTYNVEPAPQSWGGYSQTSLDPTDDMTMWTLQQYVNATDSYALRLVKLLAPPPASIVGVSPATITTGRSGVVLTVTGSSTDGAGFFDPGPAFPHRLAATFSGTGVTVDAVTVTSPTQLQIVVSTVGATAGSRDLSVANPDGQVVTRPGALLVVTNAAPIAVADAYAVRANGTLTVQAPGVLGNDTDPNGEPLTAALVSGPAHGVLTLNADGSLVYIPNQGYAGADAFTYLASDGALSSSPTSVSLTVVPNAPPTATPDSYSTAFNTPLTVPAPGVLGNDTDADGDALSAVLVDGPAHGSLALDANGGFTFVPTAGFAGTDSFRYRASDGQASSAPAAVLITVAQPTTVQPPTNLVAHLIAGNTVTLRWAPPAVGPTPTGYVLEGGLAPGDVLASLPTNSPSPVFTLQAPTGSFYVRLHALAGAQRSTASNEIRIHVNVPVPPSAPEGLIGTVNGTALNLAWRNTYEGGAPTSLQLDVTGSAVATVGLAMTDVAAFTGVPPGTYTLRLRSRNAGGFSPPSAPLTLTIPGPCSGPPLPPVDFLVYRTGAIVTAIWSPAATGPAPSTYVVNVSGRFVGSFSTSGRSLSGSAASGTYQLTVTAANACGSSAPSPPQTVNVP